MYRNILIQLKYCENVVNRNRGNISTTQIKKGPISIKSSKKQKKQPRLKPYFPLSKDLECGEPPKIPNSLRFGSVTEVTYQCDECYTGGGSATCSNGEWTQDGSCNSKYYCTFSLYMMLCFVIMRSKIHDFTQYLLETLVYSWS